MATKRKQRRGRRYEPANPKRRYLLRQRLMALAALRVCGNCGAEYPGFACDVCGSLAVRGRA